MDTADQRREAYERKRAKRHTHRTKLIELHYQEIGADQPWTNLQVNRLCKRLRMTPYELGALVCVPDTMMEGLIRKNSFPPHIALHFRLLESWYCAVMLRMDQKPILPAHLLVDTEKPPATPHHD
jgi:hypothetical protein